MLGVNSNATLVEIKHAYRRQAERFHPDKYAEADDLKKNSAEQQMRLINEAKEVLTDPYQRSFYDYRLGLQDRVEVECYEIEEVKPIREEVEVEPLPVEEDDVDLAMEVEPLPSEDTEDEPVDLDDIENWDQAYEFIEEVWDFGQEIMWEEEGSQRAMGEDPARKQAIFRMVRKKGKKGVKRPVGRRTPNKKTRAKKRRKKKKIPPGVVFKRVAAGADKGGDVEGSQNSSNNCFTAIGPEQLERLGLSLEDLFQRAKDMNDPEKHDDAGVIKVVSLGKKKDLKRKKKKKMMVEEG